MEQDYKDGDSPSAGKNLKLYCAASFILGIVSIILGLFFVGYMFIVIGLICGVLGIFFARLLARSGGGKGMRITGVIISVLGLVFNIVNLIMTIYVVTNFL